MNTSKNLIQRYVIKHALSRTPKCTYMANNTNLVLDMQMCKEFIANQIIRR